MFLRVLLVFALMATHTAFAVQAPSMVPSSEVQPKGQLTLSSASLYTSAVIFLGQKSSGASVNDLLPPGLKEDLDALKMFSPALQTQSDM